MQLVLLIRLAPYPFGIVTILFSTTKVPIGIYTLATLLAEFKTLLFVYLGSTLVNIADITHGGTTGKIQILVTIIGVIIAIVGFVYVGRLVKRELDKGGRVADEVRLGHSGSDTDLDAELEGVTDRTPLTAGDGEGGGDASQVASSRHPPSLGYTHP
ncbi:hypothetical protein HDU76_013772 [Blyttiomyces sp. JEL0837]|nr:hypothetical protein HDU76_013772 [Blyttiomyces sp. JEL0837]